MVRILVLAVFLTATNYACAKPGPKQPVSEFAKLLGRLAAEQKGFPIDHLVQAGSDLIKAARAPSVDEEIRFLILVGEKSRFPEDAKRLQGLLELVLARAGDRDEVGQARILAGAATVYRNYLGDFKKERELLLLAESLCEQQQIRQAKEQVELWLRLGDAHLDDHKKALPYYTKVCAFPLYNEPYAKRNDFKELYIKAAMRLVEISDDAQIAKLRFHPVAYPSITRFFPDRAKLLSGELPDVAAFRAQLILWLELTARDERMNVELRDHVEAVLKYVRARRN
jgi:hypothetical protein